MGETLTAAALVSELPTDDLAYRTENGTIIEARGAVIVDARGIPHRELNNSLRSMVEQGVSTIVLKNVVGQRYLGTSLRKAVRIIVEGVPGNDLGAFMDGPVIEVLNNAQDGCGNTMNSGAIVIHGSAGDILGHSMRGGQIYVRGNVGYRVAIHMKEYGTTRPVIVIGGTAQHFLGEYMAGGILIVLGSQLQAGEVHPSRFVGTGMHGGVIYVRGSLQADFLGAEVGIVPITDEDEWVLRRHVREWARQFGIDPEPLFEVPFAKLVPLTIRPYGRLYAY